MLLNATKGMASSIYWASTTSQALLTLGNTEISKTVRSLWLSIVYKEYILTDNHNNVK